MIDIPQAAYIVLCTGATTIATTALTHILVIRTESKKAAREEARENRKRQAEWNLKQNEIKTAKLAEIWSAIELSKERLTDASIQSQIGDGTLLPPFKDSAAKATSAAYGIAILQFPELRALVYTLHVETAKYETGLWFNKLQDEDAALDRWGNLITELADAIEKKARELQRNRDQDGLL
jgi:hypothetical protein